MDEQIRKKHFWLPQPKLTEENTHQPDLLNAKNAIVF
jgi:hypothetical protein